MISALTKFKHSFQLQKIWKKHIQIPTDVNIKIFTKKFSLSINFMILTTHVVDSGTMQVHVIVDLITPRIGMMILFKVVICAFPFVYDFQICFERKSIHNILLSEEEHRLNFFNVLPFVISLPMDTFSFSSMVMLKTMVKFRWGRHFDFTQWKVMIRPSCCAQFSV